MIFYKSQVVANAEEGSGLSPALHGLVGSFNQRHAADAFDTREPHFGLDILLVVHWLWTMTITLGLRWIIYVEQASRECLHRVSKDILWCGQTVFDIPMPKIVQIWRSVFVFLYSIHETSSPVVLTDEIIFSVEMKDNSIKRRAVNEWRFRNFDICRTLGHANEEEKKNLQCNCFLRYRAFKSGNLLFS